MPYFSPPTAPLIPAAPDPSHPSFDLFKHYRPWDAGINVWLMPGGTVTTVQPEQPWLAERVFHGGHIHEVDETEAAALTAAGYALLTYTPVAPSTPLPGTPDPEETGTPTFAFGSYGGGTYGEGHYGGTA